MKAIIIARVSTEEQREAGNSLPAQIARLEKYCRHKGFEIMKSFSFDESAYGDQRDEFDKIMDFVLAQKDKVAVCFDKVDRLSRNIFDKRNALLNVKILADKIELHFASERQIFSARMSAVEKFNQTIGLGLAKYYSDAISDNVKRAQEQKLRKGEWLAKAPYGYKNITLANSQTDIVLDEDPADIIKKMFALYATGAYSTETLCQKLKTDFSIKLSKSYVARILSNPFYYGEMVVKEKIYKHRYPPIISRILFDQVRQVKDSFNKQPFKYAGLSYMYRGLMRCGHCGLAITPEKHKGHVYYHCTQYNGKHGAKWLTEETITEQLGQVFKQLQVPQEVVAQIISTLSTVHQDKIKFHNTHFDKLMNEQKMATRMMDELYLDKLRGNITQDRYDRVYLSLRDQEADLSLQLERLKEAENNYFVTAKYILELANRAYDLFVSSEADEKRQLIRLVLSNLRIEDGSVRYDALKPFDAILNSADRLTWLGRKDSNLRS